jgi:hypothetical protein
VAWSKMASVYSIAVQESLRVAAIAFLTALSIRTVTDTPPLISQVTQPGELGQSSTGSRPPTDTRFGSSNATDVRPKVRESRIYEMPFASR